MFLVPFFSSAQDFDSTLQGKWNLFQIIDNMTGDVILPAHKSNPEYVYYIEFNQNYVGFNLEINKCTNELVMAQDKVIEFKYFSECTEFCCDEDFSTLLSYEDCTKFYIKENKTLILVSEDRIFYFKRTE